MARVSTVPFFVLTQLSSQIRTLQTLGADVTVIASDDEFAAQISALEQVDFVPIDISRNISPLKDLTSLVALFRAFKSKRFDIVHSTTPKAGLLCAIAAFFAGTPVRLHTFTGQPWVTMSGLKSMILKSCDKLIGVMNTHCYTDSVSQRNFLVEQKIVKSSRLSVLGSGSLAGVDFKRFNKERYSRDEIFSLRKSLGIPDQGKVILFVGRITQDKGIHELMQAFCTIGVAEEDLHLVLVGPFEENGQAIVDSFSNSGFANRVHCVGFSDEPEKFMAMADLLCLPSYREGFGTVVIEAAAMGLPTVGTSIYGLSDAVVDGITGVLVPPKDALSLGRALECLLNDSDLRHKMSEAAAARAFAEFDSVRCATLLLDDYKRLLS